MGFELFIALRYLLARQRQAFISVISLISVLGVALGVASLIVVLGVMNGFSKDLMDKILGVNAHVVVLTMDGGLADYETPQAKLAELPGVVAATPFIYSEVMASTAMGVKGVVLRGIDPATAGNVLNLDETMTKGSIADLETKGALPGIIIGEELAIRLGALPGDRINVLSPSGARSGAGFSPKVKLFTVVGTFKTGMWEYDASLAYSSLDATAEVLGVKDIRATGIELKVEDIYAADTIARQAEASLGEPFYARDWMEMNGNLFAALKLEKTAMAIILTLIVLVGSFSIVTTLIMLVMEKTRDIATLMSLGATSGSIRLIFILQGLIIGLLGTALGFGLGVPLSLLLEKYQFIELPKGVYTMDTLPVLLKAEDLVLIGVAAVVLCFLATLYPASQAARLKPAEALRYE